MKTDLETKVRTTVREMFILDTATAMIARVAQHLMTHDNKLIASIASNLWLRCDKYVSKRTPDFATLTQTAGNILADLGEYLASIEDDETLTNTLEHLRDIAAGKVQFVNVEPETQTP